MRDLIQETLTEIKRDLDGDERCYDSVTHCMTVISRIVKERLRTLTQKHPPPQAAVQPQPATSIQPQAPAASTQPPSEAEDTASWDSGSYSSWEEDRTTQVTKSEAMGKTDAARTEKKIEQWMKEGKAIASRGLPIMVRQAACPYCDTSYHTILELFHHQDAVHRRRVYACQTCPHFSRDGLAHTIHHRHAHGYVKQAACRWLDRLSYAVIDDIACWKTQDLLSTRWPADSTILRTRAEAACKDVNSPLFQCRWK